MVVFVQSHILCVQVCTRRSLIVLVSQSCVCGSVAKSKTSLKLVHQVKNTVSFVSVQQLVWDAFLGGKKEVVRSFFCRLAVLRERLIYSFHKYFSSVLNNIFSFFAEKYGYTCVQLNHNNYSDVHGRVISQRF